MNGLLHNLGWNDYWQEQWDALAAVECRPARVTREDRGQYQLVCAAGDVTGELSGKMRNTARSRSDLPAVGDWVAVRVSDAGEIGLVEAVLSRTSAFIRKAPGGRTEEQIVAANIDVVFVVSSMNADLNPRRIERYLAALDALHPEQGLNWADPDTALNVFTLQAAARASGAAVAAVDAVLAGELLNAFCAVRPPGHHAEHALAMGFCFYNNVAVAAHAALAGGLERVAVVDFDVHHGNGVQDLFYKDDRVLKISIHESGMTLYPWSGFQNEIGADAGRGYNVNIPLLKGTDDEVYVEAFESVVPPLVKAFGPDIVFAQIGGDVHKEDPLAHLRDFSYDLMARHQRARKFVAVAVGQVQHLIADAQHLTRGQHIAQPHHDLCNRAIRGQCHLKLRRAKNFHRLFQQVGVEIQRAAIIKPLIRRHLGEKIHHLKAPGSPLHLHHVGDRPDGMDTINVFDTLGDVLENLQAFRGKHVVASGGDQNIVRTPEDLVDMVEREYLGIC